MTENFTLYGYWRTPEEEQLHRGQVSFSIEEGINLKLFESSLEHGDRNEIPLILGELEDGSLITLYKCYEVSKTKRFPGTENSIYEALYCFRNVHFQNVTNLKFNRINGRFQLLNKWWNIRHFDRNLHTDGNGVDISYKLPESAEIKLTDSLKAKIAYRFKSNLIGVDDSLTIRQFCYFGIESENLVEFLNLLDSYLHFQNLLTFVSFTACYPLEVRVQNTTEENSEPIEVIYQPGFKYEEGKDLPRGAYLFYNEDKDDQLLHVIRQWYILRNRIKPVFRLFMLSFYHVEVFYVNQFLNLCQALETFHLTMRERDEMGKKVRKQDFKLRDRLEEIVDELPQSLRSRILKNEKEMIQKIVFSRNYYTHLDPKKKDKAISEVECYGYSKKLQFMLVILLIKELGIEDVRIEEIVDFCSSRYFRAAWN
jgi:hypothetical protein